MRRRFAKVMAAPHVCYFYNNILPTHDGRNISNAFAHFSSSFRRALSAITPQSRFPVDLLALLATPWTAAVAPHPMNVAAITIRIGIVTEVAHHVALRRLPPSASAETIMETIDCTSLLFFAAMSIFIYTPIYQYNNISPFFFPWRRQRTTSTP